MFVNPLNLPGPQFLVFYILVSAVTLLFIRYRFRQQESAGNMPELNLTDPYEIAFLRGGENEALRIAALSLIDRGQLGVWIDDLRTIGSVRNVRRPIEKAILGKFGSSGKAYTMYSDERLKSACYAYRGSLSRDKLIASDEVYASRRPMFFLGLFILGGLAGTKLFVALHRGRHNVLFLALLGAGSLFLLFKLYIRERTGLGDRAIEEIRGLFKGLKDRSSTIKPGGETNEVALLAAVYGVSVLSSEKFPYIAKVFPKANSKSSSSGCGSTCGTSCGSSGDSSCGGGGGGCGGCGGD